MVLALRAAVPVLALGLLAACPATPASDATTAATPTSPTTGRVAPRLGHRDVTVLWAPGQGSALDGPLVGQQLEAVPHDDRSWCVWVTCNPNTEVVGA
jgi:hypothetical protein